MLPDEVEDYRRACEARRWLSLGYDNPTRIAGLKMRITAIRGPAAAERLIEEMRRQWANRNEWTGANNALSAR